MTKTFQAQVSVDEVAQAMREDPALFFDLLGYLVVLDSRHLTGATDLISDGFMASVHHRAGLELLTALPSAIGEKE